MLEAIHKKCRFIEKKNYLCESRQRGEHELYSSKFSAWDATASTTFSSLIGTTAFMFLEPSLLNDKSFLTAELFTSSPCTHPSLAFRRGKRRLGRRQLGNVGVETSGWEEGAVWQSEQHQLAEALERVESVASAPGGRSGRNAEGKNA